MATSTATAHADSGRRRLPQLDEAIAFLQADLEALRSGEKDAVLPDLAVAAAAGEAPLPEPQFAALLAQWAPPSVPSELAGLVDRFEAAVQREQAAQIQQRAAAEAGEAPDAAAGASDEQEAEKPATGPKVAIIDIDKITESAEKDKGDQHMEDVGADAVTTDEKMAVAEEEPAKLQKASDKTDVVGEESSSSVSQQIPDGSVSVDAVAANTVAAADMHQDVEQSDTKADVSQLTAAMTTDEVENKTETPEPSRASAENPQKAEAEAALASLTALRKSMLQDVLSKIVSVARSKAVDPAMFSKRESKGGEVAAADGQNHKQEALVDLEKISMRVAGGAIAEWAQFAEQVYLFCQHVITDAEQREQPEARRKGVELLHFARTLTETLRKASVKKETSLLQKIRDADVDTDADADADADDDADADADADATVTSSTAATAPAEEQKEREDEKDAASLKPSSAGSPAATSVPATPTRTSKRIRSRKRTRGPSASASEDLSGEESHDASASEIEAKSRSGRSKPPVSPASSATGTAPAKRARTRKRRPVLPATRSSSRQSKRRAAAAAAAAAAADSAGTEEDGNNSDSHVDDKDEDDTKEQPDEQETEQEHQDDEQEDEQEQEQEEISSKRAKKAAASKTGRTRKKTGRKARK